MLNIYRNIGKLLLFKGITRDTESRKFGGTPVFKMCEWFILSPDCCLK